MDIVDKVLLLLGGGFVGYGAGVTMSNGFATFGVGIFVGALLGMYITYKTIPWLRKELQEYAKRVNQTSQ